MKVAHLAAATLLAISSVSLAAPGNLQPISKTVLEMTLAGKTLETVPLSTLENKLVADTLTIYFNKDYQAVGKFAVKIPNDPQTDTGTWKVGNDGQLCITWRNWFSGKPFCDYAYDAQNSIIFLKNDGTFVSLALKKNIVSGQQE